MNRILFLSVLLGWTFCIVNAVAQITPTDLFTRSNGKIVANGAYLEAESPDCFEIPTSMIHTYRTFQVKNGNRSYNVLLQGTAEQMAENGMYDCVTITTSDGKKLLTKWGNNPLWKVNYLTQAKDSEDFFIQMPLDDESIALIFAGWVFETGNDAGEMIIVVINKDEEAIVVYDKPAFGFSYTPYPNFALSFVTNVHWPESDETCLFGPIIDVLPSTPKYKIWKQGNRLKYKVWR